MITVVLIVLGIIAVCLSYMLYELGKSEELPPDDEDF